MYLSSVKFLEEADLLMFRGYPFALSDEGLDPYSRLISLLIPVKASDNDGVCCWADGDSMKPFTLGFFLTLRGIFTKFFYQG